MANPSRTEMNVLALGTTVRLSDDLTGIVTQICILGQNHVRYEVAWWDGNTRHSQWFESFEVKPAEERQPMRIGFNGESP